MSDQVMLKRSTAKEGMTETIARVMEEADEFESILVLYRTKDGTSGFFHAGESTFERLNWMIDGFKRWLFGPHEE